ncbi:MAG: ribbon-helix-helix protein, CopG family [Polyangiaceae bacterium]|nr:ribbon-helix-helix protein, CopG family [Polyangiaceae bacterium]MCL4755086.1 ribbon-helix-helix protein, CopG family [Myxococcales bacterium]
MRTTIDLDHDLTEKLRRLAEKQGTSLKAVVNQAIRRGLSAQEPPHRRRKAFRIEPFHSAFRAGVDPVKLNQLVDELEIREGLGGR